MIERDIFIPENILTIISTIPVFALPFSLAIRKAIGKRDNWTCQDCGDRFQDGIMVHASHYDHDKSSPEYDTINAGRIQCIDCHQEYHEAHQGCASQIGMTEKSNNWAINQLRQTNRQRNENR